MSSFVIHYDCDVLSIGDLEGGDLHECVACRLCVLNDDRGSRATRRGVAPAGGVGQSGGGIGPIVIGHRDAGRCVGIKHLLVSYTNLA